MCACERIVVGVYIYRIGDTLLTHGLFMHTQIVAKTLKYVLKIKLCHPKHILNAICTLPTHVL